MVQYQYSSPYGLQQKQGRKGVEHTLFYSSGFIQPTTSHTAGRCPSIMSKTHRLYIKVVPSATLSCPRHWLFLLKREGVAFTISQWRLHTGHEPHCWSLYMLIMSRRHPEACTLMLSSPRCFFFFFFPSLRGSPCNFTWPLLAGERILKGTCLPTCPYYNVPTFRVIPVSLQPLNTHTSIFCPICDAP